MTREEWSVKMMEAVLRRDREAMLGLVKVGVDSGLYTNEEVQKVIDDVQAGRKLSSTK